MKNELRRCDAITSPLMRVIAILTDNLSKVIMGRVNRNAIYVRDDTHYLRE